MSMWNIVGLTMLAIRRTCLREKHNSRTTTKTIFNKLVHVSNPTPFAGFYNRKTRDPSPVQPSDGELEEGGEGDPEKVWDVEERGPFQMRIDCSQGVDQGNQYENDINRGQVVVAQTELQWGESKVECEIEDQGSCKGPRQLAFDDFVKYRAVGEGDDRVEHGPHGTKEPRWRNPGGLDEL